jgi:solute carrier family 13 (sodium-dependent dicarboxylate transporter), member 2/3/5
MSVVLGMTAPLLKDRELGGVHPLDGLSDAGITIIAAVTLFLISVDREEGESLIDWATAVQLPWGVLILFGGGLALTSATEANRVSSFTGSLATGFSDWPVWLVLRAIIAIMVFMSVLCALRLGARSPEHPEGFRRELPQHART